MTRKRRERRILAAVVFGCLAVFAAAVGSAFGPGYAAYWNYQPQPGDILFQSLPPSSLVAAIEGATGSPYSHCGLVVQRDGRWVVIEAFDGVECTSLREFVFRGRGHGFAVYRLQPEHQQHVPAMIRAAKARLGLPYDVRYRMDDEAIYCSELIYKAYGEVSGGEQLGRLVQLGELNWRPYEATIRHFEGGPAPLDREMITPRDLARAEQLMLVSAYNIEP